MKKFTIAVVLLTLVSLLSFADVVAPTITGSAFFGIGYDLESGEYGIKNGNSSSIAITLVDTASAVKTSEAAVHGEIQLNGFGISIGSGRTSWFDIVARDVDGNSDLDAAGVWALVGPSGDQTRLSVKVDAFLGVTAPSIVARIAGAVWYVEFQSQPDLTVANLVSEVEDEGYEGLDLNSVDAGGGLLFHVTAGPASIDLALATERDYDEAASADLAGIYIKAAVGLTAGPATITINGGYAMNDGAADADLYGFGAKVAIAVGPLSANAAFDYTGAWELSAGVSVAVGTIMNVGLVAYFNDADNLDAKVTIGLTPITGLSATIGFSLFDVLTALNWEASVDITYALNDNISFGVAAKYNDVGAIPLKVYVQLANIVENLTFKLQYDTNNDAGDTWQSVTDNSGQIFFLTSIAY